MSSTKTEPELSQSSTRVGDDENEIFSDVPISTSNREESKFPTQSSDSSETALGANEKRPRHSFASEGNGSIECGAEINFRSLEWWQCGMVMIAETVSLGVLSLPSVLSTVGLIPGFILILGMGILASYSGYAIGQFKERYPHVNSMADAFEILCRPLGFPNVGKEFGGAAQTAFLVFSMASHILTWIICFNTLTDHATCNIVWGVMALLVFWLFDLPRTLKNMSYWSIASFASIFTAVLVTIIAVSVQDPGRGPNHYTLWPRPDENIPFWRAFLSVTNIVFAYGKFSSFHHLPTYPLSPLANPVPTPTAGHVAFFSFISELKNPTSFPKALALLQVCDITMYIIVATVVYRYGGNGVASPTLGAAGHLVKKIAFGLAIPTIIIAGVIYGHVASKYIFIRLFGAKAMAQKTKRAFCIWAAITGVLWTVAWIIAQSIPDFNDLLGVVSSLFASWFTYGTSGIFWLFINRGKWGSSPSKVFLTCVNGFLVVMAAAICGIGLYASGMAIHESAGKGGAWSCVSVT